MPETFGGRLRERREQRQIPLIAIAEETKINIALLDGLERGDVSRWPGGIFRRAFVRAYADAIGLNPDAVVREFLELYPDPVESLGAVASEGGAHHDTADGRPSGFWRVLGTSLRGVRRARSANGHEDHAKSAVLPSSQPTAAPAWAAGAVSPRAPSSAIERNSANDVAGVVDELNAPSHDDLTLPANDLTLAADDDRSEPAPAPMVSGASVREPVSWTEAATLCVQLGKVQTDADLAPLLASASRLLRANGIIVWAWEPQVGALKPALAHGYSPRVIAQLPLVRQDADNATAAAFRSGQARIVSGHGRTSGGLTVPLLGPAGCMGVLALELQDRAEHDDSVQAFATILAAQLVALVEATRAAELVLAERRRA